MWQIHIPVLIQGESWEAVVQQKCVKNNKSKISASLLNFNNKDAFLYFDPISQKSVCLWYALSSFSVTLTLQINYICSLNVESKECSSPLLLRLQHLCYFLFFQTVDNFVVCIYRAFRGIISHSFLYPVYFFHSSKELFAQLQKKST